MSADTRIDTLHEMLFSVLIGRQWQKLPVMVLKLDNEICLFNTNYYFKYKFTTFLRGILSSCTIPTETLLYVSKQSMQKLLGRISNNSHILLHLRLCNREN